METVYADKLYEFLTDLMVTAQSQQDDETAQRIDRARKFYVIPLTSEFLGESMFALREVLGCSKTLFTPEQTSKAQEYADAIRQQWFSDQ